MNRKIPVFVLALLLTLTMSSGLASAQLGLFAGKVHFNVSTGFSQTLQMTIFDNSQNVSVDFVVIRPRFNTVPNQTTPSIVVSPLSGTLMPQQNLQLNITVYMPSNVTLGTSWSSVVEVIQVTNTTSTSGAQVNSGVAKIVGATAIAPPITYFQYETILILIIIIIAVGVAVHYYYAIKKRRKAQAEGSQKGASVWSS